MQQHSKPLEEYAVMSGLVFAILLSSFFLLGNNISHNLNGLQGDLQARIATTLTLVHW